MTTEANKTFEITSTISINPTPKSIIVCFSKIDGHEKYLPYLHCLKDFFNRLNCLVILDDAEGNPLPDDECVVFDSRSNTILKGRKEIESPTGVLEFNGCRIKDVAKYLEDCTDEEMKLIMEAYRNQEIEDKDLDELIDNSIRNHKPIKTMEELADYYNVCKEYPSDFVDMIYENGWHDDTHESWGICHDDKGNRVELNENGNAEVIYA